MFSNFMSPFTESRLFPFLWMGQLVSTLGSSLTMVILPIVVYALTGSTTTMGLMMAVYMLPNVLVLPVSGWLVDRYDKISLMLLTDIVRVFMMAAVTVLIFTDQLNIHLLFVLVGIYGLMDGLFLPAYSAVRTVVFTPEIRNAANALTQVSNQLVRLIGPALGGLLVTTLSSGFGFGLDALTYLFSFFCLLYLRGKVTTKKAISGTASSHWMKDMAEGLAVLKSHPWLWITILVFAFINICYTGLVFILIPWLFNVHHGFKPSAYGFAVACSAGGAILAAGLYGLRSGWKRRGLLAYGGAFLSGLALLLMTFTPSVYGLSLLFALQGFGMMFFYIIWEISLQELVPQEAFGRVASLDMFGSFALLPLGFILIGWLADHIGGIWTMSIFASLGMVILASALLIPSIRRFD
jgi:MFS family permease